MIEADAAYAQGEWKTALEHYEKLVGKLRPQRPKVEYRTSYLLFRVADCHRRMNSPATTAAWTALVDHYENFVLSSKVPIGPTEKLLIAEAYFQTEAISKAEKLFWRAWDDLPEIPDRFRYHYAVASYDQKRYGQALALLESMESDSVFQPKINWYRIAVQTEANRSLFSEIQPGDTLTLNILRGGCYGRSVYRFDFLRDSAQVQVIRYPVTGPASRYGPTVTTIIPVSDSALQALIAAETTLRQDLDYKFQAWCTASGKLTMRSPTGQFDYFPNGCGIGVGSEFTNIIDQLK